MQNHFAIVIPLLVLGLGNLVYLTMVSMKMRKTLRQIKEAFLSLNEDKFYQISGTYSYRGLKFAKAAQESFGDSKTSLIISDLEFISPRFVWALRIQIVIAIALTICFSISI